MAKYLRKSFLIVISAPSGGGKTTICQAILSRMTGIDYSISYTTREPRKNEIDGKSYFFISRDKFEEMIKEKELLEYAEVHNNLYGTSFSFVKDKFSNNRSVIMDIDVQGVDQIVNSGIDCVTIFLLPPDTATLKERLEKRNSEAPEIIALRLSNAAKEVKCIDKYQYLIINDDLEEAIIEVQSIIIAEQNKVFRYSSPEKEFYGG